MFYLIYLVLHYRYNIVEISYHISLYFIGLFQRISKFTQSGYTYMAIL